MRVISILFILLLPSLFLAQKYGFERLYDIPVVESAKTLQNPWSGGLNSSQFSEIDLNLDGVMDLVLFERSTNRPLTFINNGSTTGNAYDYDAQYETLFPSELRDWVLLRDYNCDGKNDIFGYSSGGFQVWKNTSNATDGLQFELVTSLLLSNQLGNEINLYVSSQDIPAVVDVDGDGDLDVLTFAISGGTLEYHMNMSLENDGACGLDFVLANKCWGHFSETSSGTNTVTLNDPCSDNVPDPKRSNLHSGSTVNALDIDGNGVMDLILGDVTFNNVVMLLNDDVGVNANSAMVSQDDSFPSYDVPVDLYNFPATFYIDVNNDGKRDLIATPNPKNGVNNVNSAHFYRNINTDASPVFSFEQTNFLQDEMIDLGTSAFPAFFDYNGDGLLDLVVGNNGIFNPSTNLHEARLALFENTGTVSNPKFTLLNANYLDLPSLGIDLNAYPAFGDVNDDGKIDLVIGDNNGNIHLFLNNGPFGGTANFSLSQFQMKDNTNTIIDVGFIAYPFLFDFDNDSDLDLVIGERNGNLNYYENIGSASSPNFQFVTDNFGEVSVNEDGNIVGQSTPFVLRDADNQIQLFVGSEKGEIFHYNNINANLDGGFNPVDVEVAEINIGRNSAVAVADLNNDNALEILVGNVRGGLALFTENPDFTSPVSLSEQEKPFFDLYPNPNSGEFTLELTENSLAKIFTVSGKLMHSQSLAAGKNHIQFDAPKGLYFLHVQSRLSGESRVVKVLVE